MEWLEKILRWRWVVLAVAAALLLVLLGYRLHWTGFGEASFPKSDKLEYRPARTLWDWLGLLIVPVLLAVGGYWFNHRREELARELETDRLREEALQAYLDRMTGLMLDKSLGRSEKDDPVRDVARSQTLVTLRRLDGKRRGLLLRFLYESELIIKERTIVTLKGADLRRTSLSGAELRGVDFSEADLSRADLIGADLRGACLRGARLFGAGLISADLREADLAGANFMEAYLEDTDLRKADLRGADFFGADLRGASLNGADLRGARFSVPKNLTQDQLDSAWGNSQTELPMGFVRPEAWGDAQ